MENQGKGEGGGEGGGSVGTSKGTGKSMRTRLSKLPFSKRPFRIWPKGAYRINLLSNYFLLFVFWGLFFLFLFPDFPRLIPDPVGQKRHLDASRQCLAMTLTAGVIFKEQKSPLLWGRDNLGGIYFGRG